MHNNKYASLIMPPKKKYPYEENGVTFHRDYCFLIDGEKYNRNIACKYHDNAYGIKGGGSEKERLTADRKFLNHLKNHKDPFAFLIFIAVRLFGWLFFNYTHHFLWTGSLVKKMVFYLRGGFFKK